MKAVVRLITVSWLGLLLSGCFGQPDVTLHPADQIPEQLSDWGLLQVSGKQLRLNSAVEPYDLNTPLFTDYAHKLRTVWVPEGEQAQVGENGELIWPVGTILSKTFYYPVPEGKEAMSGQVLKTAAVATDVVEQGLDLSSNRLMETRLMVHYADGWQALSYVWDNQQQDARREVAGDIASLTLVSAGGEAAPFTYVVPDANQCAGCHATQFSEISPKPIGPGQVRHINRDNPYREGAHQLQSLALRGFLAEQSDAALPVAANWQDEASPLDARARAYLDINCGHCHSPVGAADTSGLWLTLETSHPQRLGICKPPIAAGQGTGGNRWGIAPGQGKQSILHYRMASLDPGAMMPELGRSTVHTEGVTLIEQWIDALAGTCRTDGLGLL